MKMNLLAPARIGDEALLLTKVQAAQKLAISPRHLDALLRRRGLRVVRLGRAVRVPLAVLDELATHGA